VRMSSGQESELVEEMLYVHRAVTIYKIPPRAGLASYRAAEWVEPHAKLISTCRIKVMSRGKDATIRLEDSRSGELFAETPVCEPLDKYVEPVLDSSRYFVLRLESDGGKNHAFVGMGFEERSPAFDFNVALQDHLKHVEREEKPIDWGPSKDLSLKPGESLQINIKLPKKKSATSSSSSSSGAGLPLPAAPSAGGAKGRAQMASAEAGGAEVVSWRVEGAVFQSAEQGARDSPKGDGDWADFGEFQSALPADADAPEASPGFVDFGEGFGEFADSGQGGNLDSFGGFVESADWASELAAEAIASRGR